MFKGASAKDIGILLIGVAACIGAFTYKPMRFEVVQLGTFRTDQFLLDKASGRIWESACAGETAGPVCKGRQIWQEVFVSNITPQDSPATEDFRNYITEQDKKSKK